MSKIICRKCTRERDEDEMHSYTRKNLDGPGRVRIVSGECVDCSNGGWHEVRHRKLAGVVDFNDPRYHSFRFPCLEWGRKLDACGDTCTHCGVFGWMSIDHILPVARGGGLNIENLQPLCRSCNTRKKNLDHVPPRKMTKARKVGGKRGRPPGTKNKKPVTV